MRPRRRFYASTVGTAHLRELHDLVSRFIPGWGSAAAERDPHGFTLQSGAEQIARHFASVDVHRYEDGLVVTEARPLLAYILSGSARSALDVEQIHAAAAFIDHKIATKGAIRITKESGLFVASPKRFSGKADSEWIVRLLDVFSSMRWETRFPMTGGRRSPGAF